jgi:general secretion pathway protein L
MRRVASGQVIAQAVALLRRFAGWWTAELTSLLPASWRERTRRRVEVEVADEVLTIRICRPPAAEVHGLIDLRNRNMEPPNLAALLARECASLPVWLFPPATTVLRRTVQVPRSALAHFDSLLAVDCDRWTPFSAAEIAIVWRAFPGADSRKSDVELRFVPRAAIERWTATLARFALRPSLVVLGAEQRLYAPVGAASPSRDQRVPRFAAAALALSILALLALDWIAAARERTAWQARINAERVLLVRQKQIEQQIEDLAATSQAAGNSRTTLLAAVAGVLPPSDWLTEISYRDGQATLRGYSGNVEHLLKAFEPLASDSVVTVQGELAFDARLERQRFTIAFRVGEGAP